MKRKVLLAIALMTSTLMLTSCIPSGNVVGSGEFIITYSSSGLGIGQSAFLNVNGGVVATPKGNRFRTTKAIFRVPTMDVLYTVSKYREVFIGEIPPSAFQASKLKGRNTCGTFIGVTDQGLEITGFLVSPIKGIYSLLIFIRGSGVFEYFEAESDTAKLNIGGRNLCG
jgi:hypothetical protein